ncbi:autotransporter-associated beta strand repeat-containing protein [Amorphus orientalis]|uniref:Autotransporter-associated beta strand protein n=1 Tax=Amorphus orientalis TaxID=649198 RepID=A0AAE3VST5_9HYPH|nr:autotransporter-associated beta strand repeat-containing protein [Amorphus orientalis]MDQ0317513.1 autotransporter-associated beta strand protein [Amorphus orientalis]
MNTGTGGAGADGSFPNVEASSGGGGGGAGESQGRGGTGYGAGGQAGTGLDGGNGGQGGGGGGGAHGYVGDSIAGTLTGGRGGIGGTGVDGTSYGGGGGGGGAGGYGAVYTGTSGSVGGSSVLTGGAGGSGGRGLSNLFNGGGGSGGDGGIGLVATQPTDLSIAGSVTGGRGGDGGTGGGASTSGGNGGLGGDGFATDQTVNLIVSGTVSGGAGGRGSGGAMVDASGNGGDGGTGLSLGSSATVTISGGVNGGDGAGTDFVGSGGTQGSIGLGGVGLRGSGLDVTVSGSVSGGLDASRTVRANAIEFTGGTNRLTLEAGYAFTGFVVAGGSSDTLALGGPYSSTFNVAEIGSGNQFRGFEAFEKTGSGTWTLTGTTTETTPWTVTGGTLSISADGNLGVGTVTLDGGTLGLTGSFTVDNAVTLGSSNGSIEVQTGDEAVLSGAVSGSGRLTKVGAGTLSLSGTNSYGATEIISGGLRVTSDGNLGTGTVTLNGGALQLSTNATVDNAIMLGAGNGTIDTATTSPTLSGAIGGSGNLTKISAGTLTLSGTNTYSGTTSIAGGTLAVASDSNLGAGTVRLNGTTLRLDGSGTFDNTVTLQSGGGTISVATGLFPTLSGSVGGTTLTKAGAGTLSLSGSNTYGSTEIIGGTVRVTSDGNLGSGMITLNGGALQLGADTTFDNDMTLGAGSGTIDTANASPTASGVIGGSGGLIKVSAGTLTLSGANTYSGTTTITDGTLAVASDSNLGTGAIVLAGGYLGLTGATTIDNAVSAGSGGGVSVAGGVSATLSGVVSGTGALTKTGAGTLALTGTNTHSGGTAISSGTLAVASQASLGAGNLSFSGGTLAVASSTTIGNDVGITSSATVDIGSGLTTTLSGMVSGASASLRKTGSGTLVLSGSNSHGSTLVQAGRLQIASDANLGGLEVILNGGSLALTGTTTVDNAISFTGSGGGISIADGLAATFSGALSGSSAFGKTGTGTLALSGTSTGYAGAATVSGGILQVDGTLGGASSSLQVASGGTLAGTGTVGGGVIVQSGGTLSPGASPGTLTLNGDLTLSSGSTTVFELNTPNVSGSATNDFVSVGGNLTLGGTLTASVGSAGYYYLFDYGGQFGGSFDTVTVSGVPGSVNTVDTSLPGQVNLQVLSSGQSMLFWDGSNTTANGVIDGGSGSWDGPTTNWTSSDGSANMIWGSSVGIFAGAAGTVTVSGSRTFDTLQFKTTGYLLTGGTLAMSPASGSAGTINVDGGVTTTIASTIADGTGTQLAKQGSGTLVLAGTNTYSGGTQIAAGTLQVASDAALGAAAGGLMMAGGTLATTASFDTGRAAALSSSTGGFAPAAGTTLTLSGTLTGSGALTQSGAGTLVLTGTNTYTGGTQIAAGTLQVASDAALGVAAGGLTLAGGTLSTTASVETSRSVATTSTDGGFAPASGTTLTLSGPITGSGALGMSGAGTLTLTGANTYTGGTSVASGTLIGTTSSIRGNLANAGTVEFAQTSDGTFAGSIGGLNGTNGQMVKSGAGTLTLTGASSLPWSILAGSIVSTTALFTGDVMVAAGTNLTFDQAFDGSYAGAVTGAGDVLYTGGGQVRLTGDNAGYQGETTVRNFTMTLGNTTLGGNLVLGAGGRLAGNGTVGDTMVQSGGMIAPGNSIGAITVAGNLVFEAGSVYSVETRPGSTEADLIHATGTISIRGGEVAHIGFDGAYAVSSNYPILTADGGITGRFAGVSSTLAFLDPSLSYLPNAVFLTLVRNDVSFVAVADTPNQAATAAAIDDLGAGSAIYDTVVRLDAAGAKEAYDALHGEIHGSLKTGLVEDSRVVREAAMARIQAAFSAFGGGGADSVAYSGNGAIAKPAPEGPAFSAWGELFGSWGSSDGTGSSAPLDRDTAGFLVGGDAAIGPYGRAGVLAGYQASSYDADARSSSADATLYHLGVYGGTGWRGLNLRGGASYTWSEIETARTVSYPGMSQYLTGATSGGTTQVFGEAGYEVTTRWAAVEPFAGLAYVSAATDAYTETGGTAALSVQSDTTEVTYSTLGVRASAVVPVPLSSARAKVSGLVGWRHAFGSLDPSATSAFAGGSPFTVQGTPIAEDVAVVGAGLEFDLGAMPARGVEGVLLGVSYDGQFGSGATDNAVTGRFTVRF